MKYWIAVIASAAVGAVIGLLVAWGTVAYTPEETARNAAPVFITLPGNGAACGLLVGVVAVLIESLISRPARQRHAEPRAAAHGGAR
jgi:negative regulator of sigma E activity